MKQKSSILIFLYLLFSIVAYSQENPQEILLYNSSEEYEYLYDEYIINNAPGEDAFIALQRLIAPYLIQNNFKIAVEKLKSYKKYFPSLKSRIDNLSDILIREEKELNQINLGGYINSPFTEQSPSPSADGETIFYTLRHKVKNKIDDDIFFSYKKNGIWQKGESIGTPINTEEYPEAPQSLSTDGQTLILFGNYPGSLGKGDLYMTKKQADKSWSKPVHYPKPINSPYFDCDGRITSDGKAIIFVSDRWQKNSEYHPINEIYHGDDLGNTDIFVCQKIDDNTWGEPINLGKVINTPFSERKPFLHPDGKTLYFASDGHFGLGRLDLYKSIRLNENSWTEWSTPINLGRQINGPNDDWGSIVSTDGNFAYLAGIGKFESFGGSDLLQNPLPDYAKPEGVAIIKGKVEDEKGNAISADIIWEDLKTNKILGNISTDPSDGTFVLVLPLGKNYGLYAHKEGFFPASRNKDYTNKKHFFNDSLNFTLYNINNLKDGNIPLNNIYFAYKKHHLLKESFPELNRLVNLLQSQRDIEIQIQGHTDSIGPDNYNLDLSEKRAKSVYQYLINLGKINPHRISFVGYGESQPVVPNSSDDNRQLNRRVEVKFIRKQLWAK